MPPFEPMSRILQIKYPTSYRLITHTKVSDLTPGITRRPARLPELEIPCVGGRVHAVIRLRLTMKYPKH
jgi:hypothetical protein